MVNEGKVASAWEGTCPLCDEFGAIFLVLEDASVIVRCSSCRRVAMLNETQEWVDI